VPCENVSIQVENIYTVHVLICSISDKKKILKPQVFESLVLSPLILGVAQNRLEILGNILFCNPIDMFFSCKMYFVLLLPF